jgi:hypothetical protein
MKKIGWDKGGVTLNKMLILSLLILSICGCSNVKDVTRATQSPVINDIKFTQEQALKSAIDFEKKPPNIVIGKTLLNINYCGVRPYKVTYQTTVKETDKKNVYNVTIVEDWNTVLSGEEVKRTELFMISPENVTLLSQDGNIGLLGNCKNDNIYGLLN